MQLTVNFVNIYNAIKGPFLILISFFHKQRLVVLNEISLSSCHCFLEWKNSQKQRFYLLSQQSKYCPTRENHIMMIWVGKPCNIKKQQSYQLFKGYVDFYNPLIKVYQNETTNYVLVVCSFDTKNYIKLRVVINWECRKKISYMFCFQTFFSCMSFDVLSLVIFRLSALKYSSCM